MEIKTARNSLNNAIVKAQGELIALAWLLEKNNMDRNVLNKVRDALCDAEYESRNIPEITPDVEIY